MNALQSKVNEVLQSIVPIIVYVAFLILVFVPVDTEVTIRFLIGALLVFLGLSIFLWGVDQSMEPIGHHMATHISNSKTIIGAVLFAFILGFLITIAEPDLLILGQQVEGASGGSLQARMLVIVVSAGVGIMIAIGALRTLLNKKLNVLMLIIYAVILILALRVSEEFLAVSFDASGATTGALTTPFVLALSYGLSKRKGGKNAEADSFGMVGTMSAGPILAIILLSIVTKQSEIQGTPEPFEVADGVLEPILSAFGHTFTESLFALAPIVILFLLLNAFRFKVAGRELFSISRGLIYTVIGLMLFLVGANEGFMDMGRLLGMGLVEGHSNLIVILAFVLGFIVVSAEPAVHVLGEQVEDVTGGHIPIKLIRTTLSIGVGIALALSMLRILIPEVKLWYFLLPGFALAILLSFYVDDIFVGIAFDAGGVASGPMSATFVLAFAQGVADVWPTADVLADGFGVIALIAMTPIVSIMVLGAIFKMRQGKVSREDGDFIELEPSLLATEPVSEGAKDLVFVVVDRGEADEVVEVARSVGARGATILHGRDERGKAWSILPFNLDPEKELVWFVVRVDIIDNLFKELIHGDNTLSPNISVFSMPTSSYDGIHTVGSTTDSEETEEPENMVVEKKELEETSEADEAE